jgi:NhaP-type Na+/H+ or K+/H+ antiporter
VSAAVALILFEGGLSLNFKELRETSLAVRRTIFLGGPLMGGSAALAAHYIACLSWFFTRSRLSDRFDLAVAARQ